ncbi:hypothetical protein PVNG_02470 [Plasmodium vivax North Korean]|uniref:NAD-dependent DNA ligase N-terminal domain-containing protein n=1 Tax=Plasmodium vivax North Korean TaxID=1035514 RepID=A0A0J9TNN3_PLAVI|nr:hypothetical protein PVNG_02470 [Plasmodium vivax North Korean]
MKISYEKHIFLIPDKQSYLMSKRLLSALECLEKIEDKKLKELEKELREKEEAYYSGTPTISDEEYDFKLRKFESLGKKRETVGHAFSRLPKIKHDFPMLSLDNAFNREELEAFFQSNIKLTGKLESEIEYFLEPKIDGVSVSLKYRDGQFIEGISRGDGEIGEILTEHILFIDAIPKIINCLEHILVRGEIFTKLSDFAKIKKSHDGFMNPRNYTSGTLRLKDPSEIQGRLLSFVAYQIIFLKNSANSNLLLKKQSEIINFLRTINIPTHLKQFTLTSKDSAEIFEFLVSFEKLRKE